MSKEDKAREVKRFIGAKYSSWSVAASPLCYRLVIFIAARWILKGASLYSLQLVYPCTYIVLLDLGS